MGYKPGDRVKNSHHEGVVKATNSQVIVQGRLRKDGITVHFDNGARRTVPPETLRKLIERECCTECMWLGPVNGDGTMQAHRPAREGLASGQRKVQDRTKPRCPGSNKPFAQFH